MTDSVTGAIINFYFSSPNSTALMADIGQSIFADEQAFDTSRPYLTVDTTATTVFSECKAPGARGRIEDVKVTFTVFAATRDDAERILRNAENLFLNTTATLTLDTYRHYAQYFENRVFLKDQYGWTGSTKLTYRIQNLN